MALVKVRLEAVRYLAAKARYEDDESCKKIMQLVTYKRTGVGFHNILVEPYYRDGNSPRALNVIADMLTDKVGDDWYKLVTTSEGIEYIANILQCEPTTKDIKTLLGSTSNDEYVLNFLNSKEMLLANKNN